MGIEPTTPCAKWVLFIPPSYGMSPSQVDLELNQELNSIPAYEIETPCHIGESLQWQNTARRSGKSKPDASSSSLYEKTREAIQLKVILLAALFVLSQPVVAATPHHLILVIGNRHLVKAAGQDCEEIMLIQQTPDRSSRTGVCSWRLRYHKRRSVVSTPCRAGSARYWGTELSPRGRSFVSLIVVIEARCEMHFIIRLRKPWACGSHGDYVDTDRNGWSMLSLDKWFGWRHLKIFENSAGVIISKWLRIFGFRTVHT